MVRVYSEFVWQLTAISNVNSGSCSCTPIWILTDLCGELRQKDKLAYKLMCRWGMSFVQLETRLSWRPNLGLENSIMAKSKSKSELFIDRYEIKGIAANIDKARS